MPKPGRRPGSRRRCRPAPIAAGSRGTRELVDHILGAPHPAQVVSRLQPEVLHRVIQHCGLEDCIDLIALATPGQLARVFDLDLWRAGAPGLDEQLDAGRFGVWLEVLVESGTSVAAGILAISDAGLVSAALAQHVRVFDSAALTPYISLDGEEMLPNHTVDDSFRCDVGGYAVVARRTEFWDAITAVLKELEEANPDCFHEVMRACRSLSNSRPEVDGVDDLLAVGEQAVFDLSFDRERRRTAQGFVTPAEARAFLQMSRRIDLRHGPPQSANPVARAHFRDMDGQAVPATDSEVGLLPARRAGDEPDVLADAVVEVVELLRESGVLPREPLALLDRPRDDAPRLARIHAHLHFVRDSDGDLFSMRSSELAFLANAIVAGSSVQARRFEAEEASNAAVAVCNLGLENWPPHWVAGESRHCLRVGDTGAPLPDDFLIEHDLVSVFEVGWTILHENVCMYAADRLIEVLRSFRCDDRETQTALDALRATMTRHWREGAPWLGREALDAIAILDMPAWAGLLALTDEFPVLHAAIGASLAGQARAVSASSFEFFSENRQIALVHDFMQTLPRRLR
jgi:hypothetical protein